MYEPATGKAEYYAFISHKSIDAKFALKLQKFIESYNLPPNIRRMANLQKKRLSPICSYEVDFSSHPLLDEMQGKLDRSSNLILICSEELIKSGTKYVNYEIRTFIECKRKEGIDPLTRIIPIIVSGEFGSAEHECCPEALAELGDNCPIALDRRNYKNDRELFLYVIASLLGIDYAVIRDRDKKRQRTRKTVLGIAAAALLTLSIGLAEYFIPRESHYIDFVMKNGLPEGIGPLTQQECRQASGHYVITQQKHKVQSLEYVNAYGNRIDHDGTIHRGDRPSAYIFEYTGNGLSAVTYENRFGTPYFVLQYAGNSRSAADLRNPYDSEEAFYIGSGYEKDPAMLLADVNMTAHSDISRFRYEYSPEGYVTKVFFCADSTGRLAQDNAVYGFEYTLDEKGRILETYFLDAIGERRLNSEGIYCREFAYDQQDNLSQLRNYGKYREPVANADGIVRCDFSYNDFHNFLGYTFYDGAGSPMFVAAYGSATQKQHVDDRGNRTLVELLDENGEFCKDLEYCVMAFTYDENGYLAGRTYQNQEGNPVLSLSQNYAEIRYTNDGSGNPIETAFYDDQGKLINNAYGYARETTVYNPMGNAVSRDYFNADGMPADYRGYGYSSVKTVYDERGREVSVSYFDQQGNPVNILGPIFAFGYHRLETVYEYGAHTKQTLTYYDAAGNPVNMHSSLGEEYACSVVYIQNGEITHMANYRADGSVYGDIMESETTRSPQAEPITTYRYRDAQETLRKEIVMYYGINGVQKRQTETVFDENSGISSTREVLYHENGERQMEKLTQYGTDGSILSEYIREYDPQGIVYRETLTDPSNPDSAIYTVDSQYSEDGRLTAEQHVTLREDGSIASVIDYTFGSDGSKETVSGTFYNTDGQPYAKSERVYAGDVKVSSTEYDYNENGVVTIKSCFLYNTDGTKESTQFWLYNDSGLMESYSLFVFNPDGTTTQTTYFYDEQGNTVDVFQRILDENDNVIG